MESLELELENCIENKKILEILVLSKKMRGRDIYMWWVLKVLLGEYNVWGISFFLSILSMSCLISID